MIRGAHVLLYSKDAEKVRGFLRDTLGFHHVDAGEGWLIFALPPAEIGVHPEGPADDNGTEFHLMCDDIQGTMAALAKKGVEFGGPVKDYGYGLVTSIRLPDGALLGLYEPKHPTAIPWKKARPTKAAQRPAKRKGAVAKKRRAKTRRVAGRR